MQDPVGKPGLPQWSRGGGRLYGHIGVFLRAVSRSCPLAGHMDKVDVAPGGSFRQDSAEYFPAYQGTYAHF